MCEDNNHRLENELDIQPQGLVPDVLQVHLNQFVKGGVAAPRYLPDTGEPRLYQQPLGLIFGALVLFVCNQWPGPDNAHLPLENIHKLGKLINAGSADKTSHLGDTGIVRYLEQRAVGLVPRQQLAAPFFPRLHTYCGIYTFGKPFRPFRCGSG